MRLCPPRLLVPGAAARRALHGLCSWARSPHSAAFLCLSLLPAPLVFACIVETVLVNVSRLHREAHASQEHSSVNCHQVACPVLGTQVADMAFVTILATCALQGSFCLASHRLPPLGSFLTPPLTLILGVTCFGGLSHNLFPTQVPPEPRSVDFAAGRSSPLVWSQTLAHARQKRDIVASLSHVPSAGASHTRSVWVVGWVLWGAL